MNKTKPLAFTMFLVVMMVITVIPIGYALTPSWTNTLQTGMWVFNSNDNWRTVDSSSTATLQFESSVPNLNFWHVNMTLDALTSGYLTAVGQQNDYYLLDNASGTKYGIRFNTFSNYQLAIFVPYRQTITQVYYIINDTVVKTAAILVSYSPETTLHFYLWRNSTNVLSFGYCSGDPALYLSGLIFKNTFTVPTSMWNGTLVHSISKDGIGWTSGVETFEVVLTGAPIGGYTPPSAVPTYTISTYAGIGGSITPSGNIEISYGGSQKFAIVPTTGYYISTIIVDNSIVGDQNSNYESLNSTSINGIVYYATYTFSNVVADHTIVATFLPVGGGGDGPDGGGTVGAPNATLMLGIMIVLSFGAIGFAITKGKDFTPALFFMIIGVGITWWMGFFPMWIFIVSLAGLAILLASKYSGKV